MKLTGILGFRKKPKEKPLHKRIDEAIDSDTIRKYMYIKGGINSLLFYKKGIEWDMVARPEGCISSGVKERLKEIFSKHVPIYEQLYSHVRHEIDKVKYTRNEEGCIKAVELEFCSGSGSFMTMEYQRILHERMRESMEEEKRR